MDQVNSKSFLKKVLPLQIKEKAFKRLVLNGYLIKEDFHILIQTISTLWLVLKKYLYSEFDFTLIMCHIIKKIGEYPFNTAQYQL